MPGTQTSNVTVTQGKKSSVIPVNPGQPVHLTVGSGSPQLTVKAKEELWLAARTSRRKGNEAVDSKFICAFGSAPAAFGVVVIACVVFPTITIGIAALIGITVTLAGITTAVAMNRRAYKADRKYVARREELINSMIVPALTEAAKSGKLEVGLEFLTGASEQDEAIVVVEKTKPYKIHSVPEKSEQPGVRVYARLYEATRNASGTAVRGYEFADYSSFNRVVALPERTQAAPSPDSAASLPAASIIPVPDPTVQPPKEEKPVAAEPLSPPQSAAPAEPAPDATVQPLISKIEQEMTRIEQENQSLEQQVVQKRQQLAEIRVRLATLARTKPQAVKTTPPEPSRSVAAATQTSAAPAPA